MQALFEQCLQVAQGTDLQSTFLDIGVFAMMLTDVDRTPDSNSHVVGTQ